MNQNEVRLKDIQDFKRFYNNRLENAESELEYDLLKVKLDKLDEEEIDILKRVDAI